MEQQGKEIVCGKADEANMLKRIGEAERSPERSGQQKLNIHEEAKLVGMPTGASAQ